MLKIADNQVRAVTFKLLPLEETILEFLVGYYEEHGSRYFQLSEEGQDNHLELQHAASKHSLPGGDQENPGMLQKNHLEALDVLGFVIFGKRPYRQPGGPETVPDTVTILPASILRIEHQRRTSLGKWLHVLWLIIQKNLPIIISVVALVVAILRPTA